MSMNTAQLRRVNAESFAHYRQGLVERLRVAHPHKRGMLYLDTEAGSPAEDFYRTLGYTRAGAIPDDACDPDGQYKPTAIYYKILQGTH